jgi:hypothetical protein
MIANKTQHWKGPVVFDLILAGPDPDGHVGKYPEHDRKLRSCSGSVAEDMAPARHYLTGGWDDVRLERRYISPGWRH